MAAALGRLDDIDLRTWRPDWDFGPLDEFPLYTTANIGEVIPGIISPLGASAGAIALDAGFTILGKIMGTWEPFQSQLPAEVTRGERAAFIGVFYGRAHLNLSLLSAGADFLPGSSSAALEEQYLGGVRHPGARRRTFTLAEQRVRASAVPRFLRMLLRAPRLTREQDGRVGAFVRREAVRDLTAMSGAKLITMLAHAGRFQVPVAALHLFNSGGASAGLETLTRIVRNWLPNAPEGLVEHLVTGLRDVESAKPAYEIWQLSRQVLRSPELTALFTQHPAGQLAGALASAPGVHARGLRSSVRRFLDVYGYRAMREAELSSKSWAEDPTFVYTTIKSYLRAGPEADPYAAHARQAALRRDAEDYARTHMGVMRRTAFGRLLAIAQTFVALREKTKAQWVRAMGPGRAICREAGRRLSEQGLLDQPDDVYLLMQQEFDRALRGELRRAEAQHLIARRRFQIAVCERVTLPEWFAGVPEARWMVPESALLSGAANETLRGIAVSPGRVRGRARVIVELDEDAAVEPGEILVAPYTDAAWTPLFFTAAAVVVDLGGPLSHGSTVAREYGLPAVVNVKTGTRRIHTGQEITVDGTRGEVILH